MKLAAVVMTFLPEANNMQISSMLPGTSFSAPARNSTQSAAASRICCRSPVVFTPIGRSEEHTSELQSLMRISYAVFCLKTKYVICELALVQAMTITTHDGYNR